MTGRTISDFPKLIDASYGWMLSAYADEDMYFRAIADTARPSGLIAGQEYFRFVLGVNDVGIQKDRRNTDKDFNVSKFEDYEVQVRRRQTTSGDIIPQDMIDAADNRLINWVQTQSQEMGKEAVRTVETEFAKFFNRGAYTAGDEPTFNQAIPTRDDSFEGPSHVLIYDGTPLYYTAHPQSRVVTGTTYRNFYAAGTYVVTNRSHLQTIYTVMTTTNAYDRRGKEIQIRPNQLIYHPDNDFAVREIFENSQKDSDTLVNALRNKAAWQLLPWRKLSGSDDFIMREAKKGLHVVENWKPPKPETWYDFNTGTSKISLDTWYGIYADDFRYDYGCNLSTSA